MSPMIDPSALTQLATAWSSIALQVTIKGTILLALVGLSTALLRRASASTRHLLWTLGIAGVLLLPLLTTSLPAWQVAAVSPILPDVTDRAAPVEPMRPTPGLEVVDSAPPGLFLPASLGDPTGGLDGNTSPGYVRELDMSGFDARVAPVWNLGAQVADARGLGPARSGTGTHEASFRTADQDPLVHAARSALGYATTLPKTAWLFFAWEMGVLLVLLGFGVGAVRLWWLTRTATPVWQPAWTGLVDTLASQMEIPGRVRVLRSSKAVTPMTWGLFRPVILLPLAADSWSAAQRRDVLLHELSHIKRRDCLTQTFAHLACALHWFNPLVWIAAGQMRTERERACDDQVLLAGSKASSYASHLLEMARSLKSESCTSFATVAMARRSQLSERLIAVLDPKLRRVSPGRWGTAASLALASVIVLPLAALQPGAAQVNEAQAAGAEPRSRSVRRAEPRVVEPAPAAEPEPSRVIVRAPRSPRKVRVREISPRAYSIVPRAPGVPDAPYVPYAPDAPSASTLSFEHGYAYSRGEDGRILVRSGNGRIYVVDDGSTSVLTGRVLDLDDVDLRSVDLDDIDFEAIDLDGVDVHAIDLNDIRVDAVHLDGGSFMVADNTHWVYSHDGHKMSIEIDGEVEFNDEGTDVIHMSEDAYFEIEEKRGRERHRVEMVVNRDGEIEREYFIRGRKQDWDVEAEEWLAETLPKAVRNLGINVDKRVASLYEQGGVDALLDEIDEVESDHVRSLYYREFLQLDDATAADTKLVLRQAARDLDSDFEKANMLIASVETFMADDELRQDYLDAASSIDSDFEKRRVFTVAIDERDLTAAEMADVLEAAEDIDSDFEKAQLLQLVTPEHLEDPELRTAYFYAVDSIDSDFEKSRILKELLDNRELDREGLVFVLQSVEEIDSDFESANLLTLAAESYVDDAELRGLYFDAVDEIDSDFERGRVLKQLIHEVELVEASQIRLLESVEDMDSDFERVNVLVTLAKEGLASEMVHDAYLDATDEIDSEFEYGRAMKAVRKDRKKVEREDSRESR